MRRPLSGEGLMPTGFGDLKVFSGSAHLSLTKEIADFLGIPIGQARLRMFPDSEGSFQFKDPDLTWTLARSSADSNEPDKRQFGALWHAPYFQPFFNRNTPPLWLPYAPDANFNLGNVERIWTTVEEDSEQYSLNLQLPFTQWSEELRVSGAFPDFFGFGYGVTFVGGVYGFESKLSAADLFLLEDLGAAFAYISAAQTGQNGQSSPDASAGTLFGAVAPSLSQLAFLLNPALNPTIGGTQSAQTTLDQRTRTRVGEE